MYRIFGFVFIFTVSFSSLALAHGGSDHTHSYDPSFTQEEHYRAELWEAHESLEASTDSQTGARAKVSQWLKSFNPLDIRGNMVRTFRKQENAHLREGLKDILFIFSISHPMEMTAGALATVAGFSMDWPGWLTSIAATGGFLISIPGFDPGCLILIGGYTAVRPKWLAKALFPYRWLITHGRKLVVYSAKGALHLSQIPKLDEAIFERQSGIEAAIQSHWKEMESGRLKVSSPVLAKGTTYFKFFNERGEESLSLAFDKSMESVWLSRLSLGNISRAELKTKLKGFGWNLRSAVLEAHRLQRNSKKEALAERFYVEEIKEEGAFLHVNFSAGAIHLPSSRKLRCRRLVLELASAN